MSSVTVTVQTPPPVTVTPPPVRGDITVTLPDGTVIPVAGGTQPPPIVVQPASATPPAVTVEVRGLPGLPGEPGPPGEDGEAGAGYVHLQDTPELSWNISHNLGVRPSVSVFNSGSVQVGAEVQHISENQVLVSFVLPTAGFARLT